MSHSLDFLHDSDIDLESSLPLYLEEQQIRRRVIYTGRKKQVHFGRIHRSAGIKYGRIKSRGIENIWRQNPSWSGV